MDGAEHDRAGQKVSFKEIGGYWWSVIKRAWWWAHDNAGKAASSVIVAVVLAGLSHFVVASAYVQLGVLLALLFILFLAGLIRSAASFDAELRAAHAKAEDEAYQAKQATSLRALDADKTPIQRLVSWIDDLLTHPGASFDYAPHWNDAKALVNQIEVKIDEMQADAKAAHAELKDVPQHPSAVQPVLQQLRKRLLEVERDRENRPARIKRELKAMYADGAALQSLRMKEAVTKIPDIDSIPPGPHRRIVWVRLYAEWLTAVEGYLRDNLGGYELAIFTKNAASLPRHQWTADHYDGFRKYAIKKRLDQLSEIIESLPSE